MSPRVSYGDMRFEVGVWRWDVKAEVCRWRRGVGRGFGRWEMRVGGKREVGVD